MSKAPRRSLMVAALALLVAIRSSGQGVVNDQNLDTAIVLTPLPGGTPEDAEISKWQRRAGLASATAADFEGLSWAYVAKARRTSDAGFYQLAEKTAGVSARRFGSDFANRLLRGHALHNLHRFREATAVARQLTTERGDAQDFALLSDGLMELGRVDEAVAALQVAMNLRPTAGMLSRAAQLRWLKGDPAGAIAALEEAVRAGSPREAETSAWVLCRLSWFYLQAGEIERALAVAQTANRLIGDYAPAWLAEGRALVALGRWEDAGERLTTAERLNPLPEYQWWLADVLRETGRRTAADAVETRLKRHGAATDPRTYALFLATRGEDAAVALNLARRERDERDDVLTADAVAWALVAGGERDRARDEMREALKHGTLDARLSFHAGVVARSHGEEAAAKVFFAQASAMAATLTPSERAALGTVRDVPPGVGEVPRD